MSRKVPLTHKGDAHKIEFLRTAVVGHSWAKEPLRRVATAGLKFQQLYSELEIEVQLERESNAASSSSSHHPTESFSDHKINFVGQGRYVCRNGQHNQQKKHQQRKRACFNCGSEAHLIKQCPDPVNLSRAAAGNICRLNTKKVRNAVHLVLAHLCHELDQSDDDHNGDNPEDDAKVFEQILVTGITELDITGSQKEDDIPIFSVHVHFAPTSGSFWGACIDSGAQRTVIGRKQADAYIKQIGDVNSESIDTISKSTRFRFGNTNHACDGVLHINMPVADDVVVQFDAFIVPIDVPLLLGLDVLTKLDIVIKFSSATIESERDDWVLKLIQKMGHLYVEWSPTVYYSEQELRRIHRHFFHPITDKLVNVIHRGAKEHANQGLRKNLEQHSRNMRHLSKTCKGSRAISGCNPQ